MPKTTCHSAVWTHSICRRFSPLHGTVVAEKTVPSIITKDNSSSIHDSVTNNGSIRRGTRPVTNRFLVAIIFLFLAITSTRLLSQSASQVTGVWFMSLTNVTAGEQLNTSLIAAGLAPQVPNSDVTLLDTMTNCFAQSIPEYATWPYNVITGTGTTYTNNGSAGNGVCVSNMFDDCGFVIGAPQTYSNVCVYGFFKYWAPASQVEDLFWAQTWKGGYYFALQVNSQSPYSVAKPVFENEGKVNDATANSGSTLAFPTNYYGGLFGFASYISFSTSSNNDIFITDFFTNYNGTWTYYGCVTNGGYTNSGSISQFDFGNGEIGSGNNWAFYNVWITTNSLLLTNFNSVASNFPSLVPAAKKFVLTVVNGSGSGSYTSDSVVNISANTISGEVFTNWSGLDIANTNLASTTVMMPAANLTVTANFATNAAPTVPTGLTAVAVSTNQINLIWQASTDLVGVTGYIVQRSQGTGSTDFTLIATPTGTNYSDTGLTAATTYNYQMAATDVMGNLSGYSSVASATTLSPPGGAFTAPVFYNAVSNINTSGTISTLTTASLPNGGNNPIFLYCVAWYKSTVTLSTVTNNLGVAGTAIATNFWADHSGSYGSDVTYFWPNSAMTNVTAVFSTAPAEASDFLVQFTNGPTSSPYIGTVLTNNYLAASASGIHITNIVSSMIEQHCPFLFQ